MNILFIDPFLSRESRVNIGLGYLSAILINAGHNVKVINYAQDMNWVNKNVKEMDADIIGLSLKSGVPGQAIEIANNIERKEGSIIICGGPYITVNGEEFVKSNTCFDFAVYGEAEETILEIIDYVKGEKDLRDIRGIIGRNGDGVFRTEDRGYTQDLDALPFPDYKVFDIYSPGEPDDKRESHSEYVVDYFIISSRGCPYGCIFCNAPTVLGKKWRARSIENVIEEIIHIRDSYTTIERFNLGDDNFTLKKERAKDFCRALIDKGLDITWRLPNGIRADKVDDELVSLMKQSGCESIMFGVETGSPDVFKTINKGEDLEDVEKGVSIVKKHGIKLVGSFIIGLPNSTYERDMESVRFAKRVGIDHAKFHLFAPYIKTKAYEMILNDSNARVLHDLENTPIFFQDGKPFCAIETTDYPKKDRIMAYMKANLAFYNYAFIRDYDMKSLSPVRLKNLIAVIIQYDPENIFKHFFHINKLTFEAVRRRARRYFEKRK